MVGNRAMASVLLLYYHLMREGGITNDQTVYIVSEDFNASDFVDVEVEDGLEIDQKLIREGACLSLLCDLNDLIGEYGADYLSHPEVKELLRSLMSRGKETLPELS